MKIEVVSAANPVALELLIQKRLSSTRLPVKDIKFSTAICLSLFRTGVMYSAMIIFEGN